MFRVNLNRLMLIIDWVSSLALGVVIGTCSISVDLSFGLKNFLSYDVINVESVRTAKNPL